MRRDCSPAALAEGGSDGRGEEMKGQSKGFAIRQLDVLRRVDLLDHSLGQPQLLGMQVGDFGAQRVVHGQPLADALHGLVDVVDDGDDGRGGNICSQIAGRLAENAFGERQALQRDPGDNLCHRLGVVGRDVAAGDERGVDVLAALALEAETASGQDRLAPDLVARQHDVVVEHPQYLHEPIVPCTTRPSDGEGRTATGTRWENLPRG